MNAATTTASIPTPLKGPLNAKKRSLCIPAESDGNTTESLKSLKSYNRNVKIEPQLSDEALHGLAGQIVQTIAADSEASIPALLAHFLTYTGNIFGGNPHYMTDGAKQKTNLFTAVVGKTARGRKGTANGNIKYVFSELAGSSKSSESLKSWVVDRLRGSGLCSGEGLIEQVRDANPEADPDDMGIKDKRLLIVESELSSVLNVKRRDGNTLSPTLRDAWDGSPLGVMRARTGKAIRATDTHISFIGHITLDEILSFFSIVDAHNGFYNRILWFHSAPTAKHPDGGKIWRTRIAQFFPDLQKALTTAGRTSEVTMDRDAKLLWHEIYCGIDDEESGHIPAMLSRTAPQILRLAMTYALLDCSSVIQVPHLKAAKAVHDYCEQSVRYIFDDTKIVLSSKAVRLLSMLTSKPSGLNSTEITRLSKNNWKKSEILAITAELTKHSLITERGDKWIASCCA